MAVEVSSAPLLSERSSERSGGAFLVGLIVIVVGLILGLTVFEPLALLAAVPAVFLLVSAVWQQPVRGFYLLLAATLVFEIFPLHFADSLTDRVPFFLNLNNIGSSAGLDGVLVTPAEILIVSTIVIWLAANASRRTLKLRGGPIVGAYLIFSLVVLVAEIHGMVSRGDWSKSLWELRPQAYGFVAFLMAANLVTKRSHVRNLAVIFFLAIGFKVLVIAYRYFVTLHGNNTAYDAIMAHEESYFYAIFIVGTLVALIWGNLPRRVSLLLIAFSFLCVFALVVNKRRAGELALLLSAAVVMLLAIRFDAAHRGRWLGLTILTVLGATVFTVGYWNDNSGVPAQLIHPIRSVIEPDQRDYMSNTWRLIEDANLKFTYRTSPLFGIGFGIPMVYIFPQADISKIYPLWNYIPHNTVLWIGMRMGAVGYVAFWGLIGMAILQACRQLATRNDPLLNGLAAFAIAAIVAEIVMGWSDLQLDTYRTVIVLGAVLGIVSALPKLGDGDRAAERSPEPNPAVPLLR